MTIDLRHSSSAQLPQVAAPATREPSARRVIFAGFRASANRLWGPSGLEAIGARMPADARHATVDAIIITSEMLPEKYVMAWYEAVWAGPAQRQQPVFCEFLDRMMDHGFGRIRKVLLSLVSPTQLATKAPDLWQHDHDTGVLTSAVEDNVSTFVLRNHLYTTTPLSRLAIAEIYRYALSLARGVQVATQNHGLEQDGSLRVRVTCT